MQAKLILVIFTLASLLSIILGSPISRIDNNAKAEKEAYDKFRAEHKKNYPESEYQMRFELFRQSVANLNEHNKDYEQGLTSYKMAVNKFSDMTSDEKAKSLGVNSRPETPQKRVARAIKTTKSTTKSTTTTKTTTKTITTTKTTTTTQAPTTTKSPTTATTTIAPGLIVDWVAKNKVTSIKNQGQCGSCWAFSAIALLESAYLIQYNSSYNLAEQHVVDCDFCGLTGTTSSNCNYGCGGGWPDYALAWMTGSGSGISQEIAYPYTYISTTGTCKPNQIPKLYPIIVTLQTARTDADLERVLTNIGPISICIYVTSTFQAYSSGIYSGFVCDSTAMSNINHAVLLTGYDKSTSPGFWTIKNSWGTGWGENGYIRISKGIANNICINAWGFYVTVSTP